MACAIRNFFSQIHKQKIQFKIKNFVLELLKISNQSFEIQNLQFDLIKTKLKELKRVFKFIFLKNQLFSLIPIFLYLRKIIEISIENCFIPKKEQLRWCTQIPHSFFISVTLAHLSRARGQCVYFVGLKPAEMLKVSLATLSAPLERVC